MTTRAPTAAFVPKTYAELRRAVETTMIRGQREADLAKVRTYHETGRLIHEHVLLFKERANYGAATMRHLADDLKVDYSVLLRCVQFYRAFPNLATWRDLLWAHYRVLIPLAAPQRRALATEANRNQWTVEELERRIRALQPPEASAQSDDQPAPPKPLVPKRGMPGLHAIVERDGRPAVDLGFKLYRPLAADQARRFARGDFARLDAGGNVTRADDATKAQLFTYAVSVRRVIDGDTLLVAVAVRPDVVLEEKLRLRGLDCPELDTPEGKAARRFVETHLARARAITIATFKPDKYDRYLADVLLTGADGTEVFLNNELLAAGHAVRKDEYALTDWDATA